MSAARSLEQPSGSIDEGRYRTATARDGRTVAYAEFGTPDGAPVVFLHGTPGSRLLGGILDRPATRRGVRVLSPDRPGYGRSDPWRGRSPADARRYLRPVLEDAGVDGDVDVVAFSGGAVDALALAERGGDLVESIDLVSGSVPPSVGGEVPRALRLLGHLAARTPTTAGALYRGQAWIARRRPPSFVVSQFTTADCPGTVPDWVAELVDRDFQEALARSAAGAATESRRFTGAWGIDFDAVDRPVRLHHGGYDENVPIDGARALADRLPKGTLRVLEGHDHLTTLVESRNDVLEEYADG